MVLNNILITNLRKKVRLENNLLFSSDLSQRKDVEKAVR